MGAKPSFSPKAQLSNTTSVPPPIGGLNILDPLGAMPPQDAILLHNFWPETFGCTVRPGYREHATGMNGEVCSILPYSTAAGTVKIFAVDQTNVYDITAGGPVGASLQVSTEPFWQSLMFSNAAGTHMLAFNGKDDGIWYNGASWQRLILGNGSSNATWSNVDPKNLISGTVYQKRIWAVEKASTRAWYLPPEQVYGVATAFDFGPQFIRGGYLQQLITWTIDGGDGSANHLVAISSGGDVVVYVGIDPSTSGDFKLKGVYYCGATFTRRCAARLIGDVAMITQLGLVTMGSLMVENAGLAIDADFAKKVQLVISKLATTGFDRKGWQIMPHLPENMLILNVPAVEPRLNIQYAWNSVSKAWTQFVNMGANCWLGGNTSLFFGGTGKVYRAWEGLKDGVTLAGTGGTPVQAEAQQAFSYFGTPGKLKHFKMLRPTFLTEGGNTFELGINTDFKFDSVPSPAPIIKSDFGIWDVSFWDFAPWAGGALTDQPWVGVIGLGFAASVRLRVSASSPTTWASTDWILEPGGPI